MRRRYTRFQEAEIAERLKQTTAEIEELLDEYNVLSIEYDYRFEYAESNGDFSAPQSGRSHLELAMAELAAELDIKRDIAELLESSLREFKHGAAVHILEVLEHDVRTEEQN
jgi:hypothetical protein